MKLIDFLHVPEDDELSVYDAGRNLLHPAGHFPQVRLAGREAQGLQKNRQHAAKKQRFLASVICTQSSGITEKYIGRRQLLTEQQENLFSEKHPPAALSTWEKFLDPPAANFLSPAASFGVRLLYEV